MAINVVFGCIKHTREAEPCMEGSVSLLVLFYVGTSTKFMATTTMIWLSGMFTSRKVYMYYYTSYPMLYTG